ncbi:MAG: hypothetical protein U0324_29115 [Polyangiales bacterium]
MKRLLFAIGVMALACGAEPQSAPSDSAPDQAPCGGACGVGTVCESGRCVAVVGVDAASDAPADAAAPDVTTLDAPTVDHADAATDADVGCGDTESDPQNCGACGMRCSFPGATATCVRGFCGVGSCRAGFGDCDGVNANGCEADLNENRNCGVCGNLCPPGARCVGGVCEGAPCPSGWRWCFDGCTDLTIGAGYPLRNCGACGVNCARGLACVAGQCTNPCPAGRSYCDTNISLAISCVDVRFGRRTDAGTEHCGECGHTCAAPLACGSGRCAP